MQPLLDALVFTNPPRPALKIKVLSWNIDRNRDPIPDFNRGELPLVRKCTISEVVKQVNPDVILLQELKDSTQLNYITQDLNGTYKYTKSRDNSESRVIYNSELFQRLKRNVHSEAIHAVIAAAGNREPYQDRTSSAQLQHRETKEVINFVSFHNARKSKESASKFCEIISKIFENEESLVVAGVDFNCGEYDFSYYDTQVPRYAPTGRRKVIDFFILKGEPTVNVYAVDVFPRDNDHTHAYHQFFRDLRRQHQFTQRNYSSILDHDPLVCELTL